MTRVVTGLEREPLLRLVSSIRGRVGPRDPKLLVLFVSARLPFAELLAQCAEAFPAAELLGATSAGEFSEAGESQGGVAWAAIDGDFVVQSRFAPGLGRDVRACVHSVLADIGAPPADKPHRLALVMLDALSGNGEEAALLLAEGLGERTRLAGAAAADDALLRAQVGIRGAHGSSALALVLLDSEKPCSVAVAHGHRPLSPPLRVTRASGHTVMGLEGRPAWRVWLEHTREAARARGLDPFDPASAMRYLVAFEAGLPVGNEFKIRALLARHGDDSLSFACGIPEGASIRIMESDAQRQLESAAEAAEMARLGIEGELAGALVFDCLCRKAILGEAFDGVLHGITQRVGRPFAGFESLGEIAMDANEMSGFHNASTVVVGFPR